MSKPMRLDEFTRLPALARAVTVDGLSGLIDVVADQAEPRQRFLRYQWYAASLAIEPRATRTIIVESDGDPVIALPLAGVDTRIGSIPAEPWPFRGFPVRLEAGEAAFDALVQALGEQIAALAIGPADLHDRALAPLLDAARIRGWSVHERDCAMPERPAADDALWQHIAADAIIGDALAGEIDTCALREVLIVRPGLAGRIARFRWRRRG